MILSIPFAHYIKGLDWELAKELGPPLALLAFVIVEVIPTSIMHLTHYLSNKNLEVIIHTESKEITFKKDMEYTFSYSELTITLYNPIYHKNKVDGNNRWATAWSNYSFLRIETTDNKEFNVSSTVINNDEFPLEPTHTKYSLWPSIGKWFVNRQLEIDKADEFRKKQIVNWKTKFSNLSLSEQEARLEHPEQYDELPIIAMRELLKEKSY